ncbi:MAG: hypothetical protein ACWGNI_00360 [Desulfobacterales bacterium]
MKKALIPGQKVTYNSFNKKDHGIVKSISDDGYAFVVYYCDEEWERYFDYTASRTRIDDLTEGWG